MASASFLHLFLTFNFRHMARLLLARRAGAGAAVHEECGHLMTMLPCASLRREENIFASRTQAMHATNQAGGLIRF